MRKTVPIVLSTVLAASILGTPTITIAQTEDAKAETAQSDNEQINLSNCWISFNNSLICTILNNKTRMIYIYMKTCYSIWFNRILYVILSIIIKI